MHILITDSGVGGLSVVAYAERFVRTRGFREPVRLTFANAAPENDYGYNAMPTREAKIETFDRFLRNVTERFAPDMIYVACNTLSVLLPDTPYFATAAIPVKGIVETGVALLLRELEADPASVAIVFGTQTTIDAGAYPWLLVEAGIDPSRIVSQACPGLADTISEDREGTRTRAEIEHWVAEALAKMPPGAGRVVACLACTHYGYRKDVFERSVIPSEARNPEAQGAAPQRLGIPRDARDDTPPTVINPNESAIHDLFDANGPAHHADVQFVTRYALPPATVENLAYFLGEISPKTVAAMRNFVHLPGLF